jgi:hypothetical protein
MAKASKPIAKSKGQPEMFKGWKRIAEFLGEPFGSSEMG